MKRILIVYFTFLSSVLLSQTLLLEDNFDYSTGTLTTVTVNWTEAPTGSTDIQVATGNLSYTNYPSSNIGKLIVLDGGAAGRSGVYRTFSTQTSAGVTVYGSFLLNVTSTTDMDINSSSGDYFANFQNSAISQIRSYIYVRQGSGSSKYSIGLAKSSSASLSWYGTELDINVTYLIVIGYSIVSGTDNDISKLWINPDLSGSEPSADISVSSGSDATDIASIQFRQRSKSGDMQIDGVRVADAWSQAPLPVELTSFTSNVNGNKVVLNWQTATEVNNYGFEVERSAISHQLSAESRQPNADSWSRIGFVQGNGNSNSPKNYSFTDVPLGGKVFKYRLKQIDFNGAFEYSKEVTAVLQNLASYKLEQNYPNPFNPVTKISYTIPQKAFVRLRVYDMLARQICELVNSDQEAGRYEALFDAANLPSGSYFYKLEAGKYVEVKKLLLVK
jgi:hypothetical protein